MFLCHGLLCDRTAAVWMRGKAWCVPCSIKRFGFTTSALETAEAVAPEAAPRLGVGVRVDIPSSAPAPGHLSDAELLDVLERDGWLDAEIEWFTRTGGTLPDLERFLVAHLNEGIEP